MFRKQRVCTGTSLVVGVIFALLLAAFMFSSRPLLAQGPTPQPTPPVNEMSGQDVPQLIHLPLLVSPGGAGTGPNVPIAPTTGAAIEENYRVEDALAQFLALKHHGEAIGWWKDESKGAPDPSNTNHYQGLVRYPGEGVPTFYVTQLNKNKEGGFLLVVTLRSRPQTGERLRSNLQVNGQLTIKTVPPQDDTWLYTTRFDGTWMIDNKVLPAYKHPGGMAIIDDILFVPLDTPVLEDSSPPGYIVLFDLSDDARGRENPTPIQAIPLTHEIDNLAVTEYGEDAYLIWTNGAGGDITKFYVTTTSDLRDDHLRVTLIQNWDPNNDLKDSEGWPGDYPSVAECAHQSSTFLRDANGSLYMIAMRHGFRLSGAGVCGSPIVGADTADFFKVEIVNGRFTLFEKDKKRFYCVYNYDDGTEMRLCNFGAASTAYVSPSSELILYSIPHDDWDRTGPDIVRMSEFRHCDVYRENNPLRYPTADAGGPYTVEEGGTVTLSGSGAPPVDRPWVELYDDDNFGDRSIVVDYDDRSKLELNNFGKLDGFNDKTTAVRWRAPVGLDIELYDDDNFRDRYVILKGTGLTQWISDLEFRVVVPGVVEHPGKYAGDELDFNDKTSSLRFVGDEPSTSVSLVWDLDGDGVFGETGAAATRGDETGETPTFDAADLDGPTQVNVSLRVTFSGVISATDTVVIEVMNVAPSVDAGPNQTVYRNDVVTVSGTWTDPAGDFDNPYSWWWDLDGDDSADSSGTASYGDAIVGTTSFALEGSYTLTLNVTDKDGGSGGDSLVIDVLNRPPDCSEAGPSIDIIWPADHKFVPVNVLGVTDPEQDEIAITIESIYQDEPVDTYGDGSFTPDGQGVGTDTAQVRAERAGTKKVPGNGRVYHIGFSADDGHGGSCWGEVLVGVPHDIKDTPVDEGALYDSTALAP